MDGGRFDSYQPKVRFLQHIIVRRPEFTTYNWRINMPPLIVENNVYKAIFARERINSLSPVYRRNGLPVLPDVLQKFVTPYILKVLNK